MNFDLSSLPRGYVTRAQILESGHNDRDIRAAVGSGLLLRRRQGIYVHADSFALLGEEQQHVVDLRSVVDRLAPGVAVSHGSACVVHDLPTFGVDLGTIDLIRLDSGSGRAEYGIVHHVGQVDDDDLMQVDGMTVMKPARAVFEVAMVHGVEAGIVVMDAALHRKLITRDDLRAMGERCESWPGGRGARYAASLADGRSESPGESRSRFLFRRKGLPAFEPQYEVRDEDGVLVGRGDFGWPEYRHIGESDGFVKYGGIPGDARTPQQIVWEEKKREDRIRRLGWGFSRWVWADLDPSRSDALIQRLRRDLEQSRRLYTRNAVHLPLT